MQRMVQIGKERALAAAQEDLAQIPKLRRAGVALQCCDKFHRQPVVRGRNWGPRTDGRRRATFRNRGKKGPMQRKEPYRQQRPLATGLFQEPKSEMSAKRAAC